MRKATGIVRKLDDLGRIVLPKELRTTMSLAEGDGLEIFVDSEGEIILKKYQPGCTLCGNMENLQQSKGKPICMDCINDALISSKRT